MNFEQLMGTLQIAVDSIKRGDIDEAEVARTWDDEDTSETVHIVLRRDVVGRLTAKEEVRLMRGTEV